MGSISKEYQIYRPVSNLHAEVCSFARGRAEIDIATVFCDDLSCKIETDSKAGFRGSAFRAIKALKD